MARAVDGDGGDWESGPHCAVGGVRDGNVMTNRPLQFQNYESKERELDELERLIHLYSNKQEYYIALSLAFSAHCYDFGYRNFQHYMKNKCLFKKICGFQPVPVMHQDCDTRPIPAF